MPALRWPSFLAVLPLRSQNGVRATSAISLVATDGWTISDNLFGAANGEALIIAGVVITTGCANPWQSPSGYGNIFFSVQNQ